MDKVKSWLTSRTVIVSALGVLASALGFFGFKLDLDINMTADQIVAVTNGVLFIGAAIFRILAKHKLAP